MINWPPSTGLAHGIDRRRNLRMMAVLKGVVGLSGCCRWEVVAEWNFEVSRIVCEKAMALMRVIRERLVRFSQSELSSTITITGEERR